MTTECEINKRQVSYGNNCLMQQEEVGYLQIECFTKGNTTVELDLERGDFDHCMQRSKLSGHL